MTLEIYVDDVLAFSKSGMTKTSEMTIFKVDLKNASVLKIQTSNQGEYYCGFLMIVDEYVV